jgi:peptidoglycan LD-endopeptidase LytH
MIRQGIWSIIAAVLLLGHTPVLAESYLRVCKKGVVYYYFASREPTQSRKASKDTSKPRGEAWIEVPSQRHQLATGSGQWGSEVKPAAVSPAGVPAPAPVTPGTAANLAVVTPPDAKKMIFPGSDYLISLLTKLGCRSPLALPAYVGLQVGRYSDIPALKAPEIVAPEGWKSLLKEAQEQSSAMGRARLHTANFNDSGANGYRFPVAGPFSFRDTWGDSRSGGRMHRAVDIFAPEGAEVYAVTTGVIAALATIKDAGITLFLRGQDGKGYGYMHLQGYAAGMVEGRGVRTGELIGYVGRTGMQTSAAHLHFQVYADHRLCKDELLNPYGFLVQLCHGIGVTDLYQHNVARFEYPAIGTNGIKIYRRPYYRTVREGLGRVSVKDPRVLVIKNY